MLLVCYMYSCGALKIKDNLIETALITCFQSLLAAIDSKIADIRHYGPVPRFFRYTSQYWWFTTLVLGPCQLPWWEPPSHHSLLLWTWTCLTVTLLRQEEIILGKNFEILCLHTNLNVMDFLYYTHLPQLWHWSVCYLLWARTQQQPW